jgi:uncharacterized hydantoinase/oxoprolinase family protein
MTHSIHVGPPATSRIRSTVLGWDIGRVNTKAVRVEIEDRRPPHPRTVSAVDIGTITTDIIPVVAGEGVPAAAVAWLLADAIATA